MNRLLGLVASLVLLYGGCAHYSTSATGGSGFQSIGIPLLENESLEPEIQQTLTDSLIQGFVSDAAMRVVDENRADVVLRGTIVEVLEEPFTYGDQADQYRITVYMDVSCYDARQKKVLWEEKRLKGYGIYSAAAQREEARKEGLGAAFQILTRDIVDRAQVGGW
ncbi:MAG: LptE family protein [bacterium]|nr:LptE family protein [bacterium]